MKSRRFWKVTATVLVALVSPVVIAWVWLLITIMRSPSEPNPPVNVVPFNNHGHYLYITLMQSQLLDQIYTCWMPIGAVMIGMAVIASLIGDRLPKSQVRSSSSNVRSGRR